MTQNYFHSLFYFKKLPRSYGGLESSGCLFCLLAHRILVTLPDFRKCTPPYFSTRKFSTHYKCYAHIANLHAKFAFNLTVKLSTIFQIVHDPIMISA